MNELIGYENQLKLLTNDFYNKKISNSIIIHGPKGIGKRLFIDTVLLSIFKLSSPNNFTHNYNLLKNNSHPNVRIVKKDIDSKTKKIKNNISIDQIRNLNKFIYETPSIINLYKFIVIDSADDLNISSSNSLLKILEEPHQDTFIILISHQLSNLIPTIRSRCLKIIFNTHSYKNFKNIIISKIKEIDEEEIEFLYNITNGSPGVALSFFDDDILDLYEMTLNCLSSDSINNDIVNFTNILSKFDNDKFKNYLLILRYILLTLHKIKLKILNENSFNSLNFKKLISSSSLISGKIIIDRFNFLAKNESDLFKLNLDKKLFMLKFLNI